MEHFPMELQKSAFSAPPTQRRPPIPSGVLPVKRDFPSPIWNLPPLTVVSGVITPSQRTQKVPLLKRVGSGPSWRTAPQDTSAHTHT